LRQNNNSDDIQQLLDAYHEIGEEVSDGKSKKLS